MTRTRRTTRRTRTRHTTHRTEDCRWSVPSVRPTLTAQTPCRVSGGSSLMTGPSDQNASAGKSRPGRARANRPARRLVAAVDALQEQSARPERQHQAVPPEAAEELVGPSQDAWRTYGAGGHRRAPLSSTMDDFRGHLRLPPRGHSKTETVDGDHCSRQSRQGECRPPRTCAASGEIPDSQRKDHARVRLVQSPSSGCDNRGPQRQIPRGWHLTCD